MVGTVNQKLRMGKIISVVFLFILTHSIVNAQSGQLDKDSLKREQKAGRRRAHKQERIIDKTIKKIESGKLSEKERNRITQKVLKAHNVSSIEEFRSKYNSLRIAQQFLADSIELQIAKIDSLKQVVIKGSLSEAAEDSLRQEIQRFKSIMKNYVSEIDLLTTNTQLTIDNADMYYYNLKDHKKPKIYFYSCPQDPKRSQYWKVSANLKRNTLLTEAFDSDLVQFERFEEKYDSLGSKLVDYKMIGKDSSTSTSILKDVVYSWQSSNGYFYKVNFTSPDGIIEFSKNRRLLRLDTILVLGSMKEVIVFCESYSFYNTSSYKSYSYTQYSSYAKGIGFVMSERSIPINDTDYEFINLELDSILTEKEWKKILKNGDKIK